MRERSLLPFIKPRSSAAKTSCYDYSGIFFVKNMVIDFVAMFCTMIRFKLYRIPLRVTSKRSCRTCCYPKPSSVVVGCLTSLRVCRISGEKSLRWTCWPFSIERFSNEYGLSFLSASEAGTALASSSVVDCEEAALSSCVSPWFSFSSSESTNSS